MADSERFPEAQRFGDGRIFLRFAGTRCSWNGREKITFRAKAHDFAKISYI